MGALTDWLVAIGTIALAVIAVFQDRIRRWIMRPQLTLSISVSPPDCHKTRINIPGSLVFTKCYYFRLKVKNSGQQRAEQVEVFAAELRKLYANGEYIKIDSFLPMDLLWSHVRKPYQEAISPGMEKHCDLCHVIDPKMRISIPGENDPTLDVSQEETVLSLDVEVKPLTLGYLLQPGKYQLDILIAAANIKPIRKTISINHVGQWFSDEHKMLKEGISFLVTEN